MRESITYAFLLKLSIVYVIDLKSNDQWEHITYIFSQTKNEYM